MSGTVVLDDRRMIDRDVGGPLLEVVDRAAALAHDLRHEFVRVNDCARGVVDERGLHGLPLTGVPLQCGVCQRNDFELVALSLALCELSFGRPLLTGRGHGAFILWSEPLLESAPPLATAHHEGGDQHHHGDHDHRHDHNPYPDRHSISSSSYVLDPESLGAQ